MSVIHQFLPSYDEALAFCDSGYEDHDIPLVVGRKTVAILPLLRQTLLDPDPLSLTLLSVLSAGRRADPIRVIDVGGGCGYHYFATPRSCPI